MKKIIILGSQHINTQRYSEKLGLPKSILITPNNQNTNFHVGHTSIQDMLFYENLDELIKSADELYWAFPNQSEFSNREFYLEYIWWIKKVQSETNKFITFPSFYFDPYNLLQPVPELNPNDAVFVGCSFTEGVGLERNDQRFSDIVAKKFNTNCVNLGKGGGSNNYSFELLSNLKFYENQIVILQLTSWERMKYFFKDESKHLILSRINHYPKILNPSSFLEVFTKEFLLYETIQKLNLFQKFAEEKKLRFAFFLNDYKCNYTDQLYFYNFKSFVPYHIMQDYFVDVGTDNMHPGPESNKNIANIIISFLEMQYK